MKTENQKVDTNLKNVYNNNIQKRMLSYGV